jgi:hypothetical protein
VEHSADRDVALDLLDGSRAGSCPEAEAPDLRPADALPQALAAWDASDDAHRDEAAAVADLHRVLAWVDAAGKLVVPAPDVREPHASRRQWELQVALEAEPDEPELCTRVVALFAERSSAAPAAEQLVWTRQKTLAERLPTTREQLEQTKLVHWAAEQ